MRDYLRKFMISLIKAWEFLREKDDHLGFVTVRQKLFSDKNLAKSSFVPSIVKDIVKRIHAFLQKRENLSELGKYGHTRGRKFCFSNIPAIVFLCPGARLNMPRIAVSRTNSRI